MNKIFSDPYEHLNMDEKTRKFIKARDKNILKKKMLLLLSLLIVLAIVSVLRYVGWISEILFQYIVTAFLGGFIGSTLSYLIAGEK